MFSFSVGITSLSAPALCAAPDALCAPLCRISYECALPDVARYTRFCVALPCIRKRT